MSEVEEGQLLYDTNPQFAEDWDIACDEGRSFAERLVHYLLAMLATPKGEFRETLLILVRRMSAKCDFAAAYAASSRRLMDLLDGCSEQSRREHLRRIRDELEREINPFANDEVEDSDAA